MSSTEFPIIRPELLRNRKLACLLQVSIPERERLTGELLLYFCINLKEKSSKKMFRIGTPKIRILLECNVSPVLPLMKLFDFRFKFQRSTVLICI